MKKSLRQMLLVGLSATLLVGVVPAAYAQDDNADDQTEETSESAASSEESSAETSSESAESGDTTEEEASDLQQGVQAAIDRFMTEYPDADIEEIDVELQNEIYEINIDGFAGEEEYDMEIRWENSELTDEKFETDNEDDDSDDNQALDLENLITIDEASDIATEEAGFGEAHSWTLDSDDDDNEGPEWDIEIRETEGGREAEIEIDAETGDVLNTDIDDNSDNDDDDDDSDD